MFEVKNSIMSKFLIKNGRLVTGEVVDIEVEDGVISRIEKNIKAFSEHNIINLNCEKYISAGWIDVHTHCFSRCRLYSDKPDEIGYKKGVTTVVDAGTAGADTIEEFFYESKESKTNVFAFINIASQGISTQEELSNIDNMDRVKIKKICEKYKDFIVGIKARMSKTVVGENGIRPLLFAKQVSVENKLPLMVHIGSEPPKLDDILKKLDSGDIVSHIFNGKPNGIMDRNKKIKKCVKNSYDKGVLFDLAHGTDSFNFDVCIHAMEEGIKCYTISTDIYIKNRINGPVYDLSVTMTKLLNIGYTLEEVIDMVTINASKLLKKTNIGNLKVNCKGDLTIFDVNDEKVQLVDSNNINKEGITRIKPCAVLLNGEYIELS